MSVSPDSAIPGCVPLSLVSDLLTVTLPTGWLVVHAPTVVQPAPPLTLLPTVPVAPAFTEAV
ncbi:MAG: hypothetical protein ACT6SF_19970 [Hydrogenophaga sp.]|uniref:hypothetical protein n=1 Tax=Hydrogenophaga sp. TaxID=1904254 RepID=UPI004035BEB0